MSKRKELRDIEEQKRLVVAKADLQRATFLMLTRPVFKVIQAAEVGFFVVNTGKAAVRRKKR